MRYIWLATIVFYNATFLATPMSFAAPAGKNAALVQEAFKASFPSKKISMRDFIKTMKKNELPAASIKDIEKRAASNMSDTIEYDTLGSDKFVLKSQGNEVIFEVVDLQEGAFKINNRKVTLDFSQSPERIWQDVQSALDNKSAANPFMALLLPRAHAISWGWIATLGAAVTGLGLYMYGKSNCSNWRQLAEECANVTTMSAEAKSDLLGKITSQDKWWKIGFNCGKVNGLPVKDIVRKCALDMNAGVTNSGTPVLRSDDTTGNK